MKVRRALSIIRTRNLTALARKFYVRGRATSGGCGGAQPPHKRGRGSEIHKNARVGERTTPQTCLPPRPNACKDEISCAGEPFTSMVCRLAFVEAMCYLHRIFHPWVRWDWSPTKSQTRLRFTGACTLGWISHQAHRLFVFRCSVKVSEHIQCIVMVLTFAVCVRCFVMASTYRLPFGSLVVRVFAYMYTFVFVSMRVILFGFTESSLLY